MKTPTTPEIRTYRYLRLGMIAVLVMRAAAVLIERAKGRGCWQGSVSAYNYTPAQAVFVGALIAIGVSMVVLKGSTNPEDMMLNIGGMFAPIVALVPTPGSGDCWSVEPTQREPGPNIANNLGALFIAGGLSVVVAAYLGYKAGKTTEWDRRHTAALVASILVYAVGIAWFFGNQHHFQRNAHYVAAVLLFVAIVAVVFLNARNSTARTSWLYNAVAALMAVGIIAGFVGWRADGKYALLVVEAALIVLFLAFWTIQTVELWNRGLRVARPPGLPWMQPATEEGGRP